MKSSVLSAMAKAPVTLNIPPDVSGAQLGKVLPVLAAEGFPIVEILGRPMDQALAVLRELRSAAAPPGLYVGVGTVLTAEQARAAVAEKPDFLVSPAFSKAVLAVAAQADIPYVPGVSTLQDIQDVLEAFAAVGWPLELLKVCPVDFVTEAGLRVMAGIYKGITYCVTGTVPLDRLAHWKSLPGVGPAMESSYLPTTLIAAGNAEPIRARLAEIRAAAGG